MAIVYMNGLEGQSVRLDNLTSLTGQCAYSTVQARTGSSSLRCNAEIYVQAYATGSAQSFNHFGLYVATLPSVNRQVYGGGSGSSNIRVFLKSTGALEVYNGTTLIGTSSSTAFSSPGWHWVGIRAITGTDVTFLQIDGNNEVSGTATVTNNFALFGCNDTGASAVDFYIDDIIQDNAGFVAPSKVALLRPISDNARATLWTNGIGGSTNLYDAVNNTPPVGLGTETATSQIEHAGGAAGSTDAYDANMTTYTTAGVGALDTVLALQGLIVWGEDSGTGTKLLSYSGVSNPSWTGESSIDVSTGDGSGATVNYAGTASDYWNERRSAIVLSPSVTLGTSPVMRVLRPETASRVASVCFMGIYVAWTPFAPTGSFTGDAKIRQTRDSGSFKGDATIMQGTRVYGSFKGDSYIEAYPVQVRDAVGSNNGAGATTLTATVPTTVDGDALFMAVTARGNTTIDPGLSPPVVQESFTSTYSYPHFSLDGAYCYFLKSGTNTIEILDVASETFVTPISLGVAPREMEMSPDGANLWVTYGTYGTSGLKRIRTSDNTVVATITGWSGTDPYILYPYVQSDSAYVWVTVSATGLTYGRVDVVRASDNTIVSSITFTAGADSANRWWAESSSMVYLCNYNGQIVHVMNRTARTLNKELSIGYNYARGLSLSPDGTKLYVAADGDYRVVIVQTSDNTVLTSIYLQFFTNVEVSADSAYYYCYVSNGPRVYTYDAATNTQQYSDQVGLYSNYNTMQWNPDRTMLLGSTTGEVWTYVPATRTVRSIDLLDSTSWAPSYKGGEFLKIWGSSGEEVIIACCVSGTPGTFLIYGTQWTQLGTRVVSGTTLSQSLFWKRAVSEPASYDITLGASAAASAAIVSVDGGVVVEPASSEYSGQSNASSVDVVAPAIGTWESAAGLSLFFGGSAYNTTPAAPSGYTEEASSSGGSGSSGDTTEVSSKHIDPAVTGLSSLTAAWLNAAVNIGHSVFIVQAVQPAVSLGTEYLATASAALATITEAAVRGAIAVTRATSGSLSSVSESAVRVGTVFRASSASLASLDETITSLKVMARSVAQALGATSEAAVRAAMAVTRSVPQALGSVSEVVVRGATAFSRAIAQALGTVSETIVRGAMSVTRSVPQTLGAVSEVAARAAATLARTISQSLGSLSEVMAGIKVLVRSADQTLGTVSESIIRAAASLVRLISASVDALSEAVVRLLGEPNIYTETILADVPGGYWRVGETAGTNADEISGAGSDGTYVNAPTLGILGALAGDGDTAVLLTRSLSQYITTVASTPGDVFSYEIWFKRASIGTDQVLFATNPTVVIHITPSNTVEATNGVASFFVSSETIIDTVDWHHLVVTKDGVTRAAYLDAIDLTNTSSNSTVSAGTNLAIGAMPNGSNSWDGGIDEPAVYAYVLSADKVKEHHNHGKSVVKRDAGDTASSITEAITRSAMAKVRAAGDAIGSLGEAVARGTATFTRTVSEAVNAISELVEAIKELGFQELFADVADDLAAISESVARSTMVVARSVSQAVDTLTETVARAALTLSRSVAQTVGAISEAIVRGAMSVARSFADVVGAHGITRAWVEDDYITGDKVIPSTGNHGFYYLAATDNDEIHTSGSTEPVWPTHVGGTVMDSLDIVWTAMLPTASLAETVTRATMAVSRAVAQALGSVTEAIGSLKTIIRSTGDSLSSVAETVARAAMAKTRDIGESIDTLGEAVVRAAMVKVRTVADDVSSISEIASRAVMSVVRVAADAVDALSEVVARNTMVAARSAAAALSSISESLSEIKTIIRSTADVLGSVAETVARGVMSVTRTVAEEVVSIAETMIRAGIAFIRREKRPSDPGGLP